MFRPLTETHFFKRVVVFETIHRINNASQANPPSPSSIFFMEGNAIKSTITTEKNFLRCYETQCILHKAQLSSRKKI